MRYQFPLTPGTDWRRTCCNLDPQNQLESNIQRYREGGGLSVRDHARRHVQRGRDAHAHERGRQQSVPLSDRVQLRDVVVGERGQQGARDEVRDLSRARRRPVDAFAIRAQNTVIELASYSRADRLQPVRRALRLARATRRPARGAAIRASPPGSRAPPPAAGSSRFPRSRLSWSCTRRARRLASTKAWRVSSSVLRYRTSSTTMPTIVPST